jgi:hypothetical protein
MEPAEVPVFEEHKPEVGCLANLSAVLLIGKLRRPPADELPPSNVGCLHRLRQALHVAGLHPTCPALQPTDRTCITVQLDGEPMGEGPQQPVDTPPGAELALSLPQSSPPRAAAGDDAPARWSLDLSCSTHSDWEVVSAGHHSSCGSSPRSVTRAEACDSDGEERAREAASALPKEAAVEGQAAAPAGADAAADLEDMPGGLLDPAGEQSGGEAVEAALGSLEGAPPAETCDSPRSSFERPLSHAGGDDVYSVSQVGAAAHLCLCGVRCVMGCECWLRSGGAVWGGSTGLGGKHVFVAVVQLEGPSSGAY